MFKPSIIPVLCALISLSCYANQDDATTETQFAPSISPYSIVPEHLVKRFYIGGTVRAIAWASDHTPTTIGMIPPNIGRSPGATDINLTTAILSVNAELSDWIASVIAIAYEQTSPSFVRSPLGGGDTLIVDRAYIRFANPQCTPFAITIGRLFIPFGGLDTSSFVESPTQLLSLNRESIFYMGIENWYGFSAHIFTFRGLRNIHTQNDTHLNSFAIGIKYELKEADLTLKLGTGYLNNITSGLYPSTTVARDSPLANGFFHTAVGGIDLNAAIAWQTWDLSLKFVGSLNPFSGIDLPITTNGGKTFRGAKPAGWDLNMGYEFPVVGHTTRLGIGYQGSREAVSIGKAPRSTVNETAGPYGNFFAIGIPFRRYYANYNFNIMRRADIAVEIAHDRGYGSKYGGTGRGAYTALAVVTVSK